MAASRTSHGTSPSADSERSRLAADVRARLDRVLGDIEEAVAGSGRKAEDVTVVAVTKGHPVDAVRAAVEAGIRDVGENRVGELARKVEEVGRHTCRWHMVGHLQRRKAPRLLGLADLLHSLDSIRLAERMARVHEDQSEPFPVLVQVNTSGEETKSGLGYEEALDHLGRILELGVLDVRGFMTMAPLTDDEGEIRRAFRRLRELHERARRGLSGYEGTELSMGMSNDYRVAVEEGSTMVRLGTVLLGERPA